MNNRIKLTTILILTVGTVFLIVKSSDLSIPFKQKEWARNTLTGVSLSSQPSPNSPKVLSQTPLPTAHDEAFLNMIGAIVSDPTMSRQEKMNRILEIYNKNESLIISDAALDGLGVLSPIEITDELLKILTDPKASDGSKAKAVTALYNAYIIPWDIASSFSRDEIIKLNAARSKISKNFKDILMSGRSGEAVTHALLYAYGVTNSLDDNALVFQQIREGMITQSEAAVQFQVSAAMTSADKQKAFLPILLASENPLEQAVITSELSKSIVNEIGFDSLSAADKKSIYAYLDAHQPVVSDEIPGSDSNYAYWQLAKQMMLSASKSDALAILDTNKN
jgi:hypothetical protein